MIILLKKNIFTCFVSSNTVFKSQDRVPNEKSIPNPGFEYAVMKYETELAINKISVELKKQELVSIFRMTKNISCNTKPFDQWILDIQDGNEIVAFKDLFFSPIRFQDSVMALSKIMDKRLPGICHMSGESDISYSDFAHGLKNYLGVDNSVKAILSDDAGVKLSYNHHITSLSMKYSIKHLDIKPIKLVSIYSYLEQCIGYRIQN